MFVRPQLQIVQIDRQEWRPGFAFVAPTTLRRASRGLGARTSQQPVGKPKMAPYLLFLPLCRNIGAGHDSACKSPSVKSENRLVDIASCSDL